MSEITWAQLTTLQRETLQDIKQGEYVDHMPNTLKVLRDLGLIEAVASYMGVEGGYSNYRFTLTDAGRAVLASAPQAQPATEAAGDVSALQSEQALDIVRQTTVALKDSAMRLEAMDDYIVKQDVALAAANARADAAQAEANRLREALTVARQGIMDASEMAGSAQGQWVSVHTEYAPSWTHDFKQIERICESVFDELGWQRGYETAKEAFVAEQAAAATGAAMEAPAGSEAG